MPDGKREPFEFVDGDDADLDEETVAEYLAAAGVHDPTAGLAQAQIDEILLKHAKGRWVDPDDYPYELLNEEEMGALAADFKAAPRLGGTT